MCDSEFSHRNSLKNHEKAEHLGVKHNCPICSFITKTKSSLRIHMAVHSDKLYSCDQCDKTFRLKFSLNNHIEALHNQETFSCDSCNYVVKSRRYLRRHVYENHEGRDFPCIICEKIFDTPQQMYIHKKKTH